MGKRNKRFPVKAGSVHGSLEALTRIDLGTRLSVARWSVKCRACGWAGTKKADALQNVALNDDVASGRFQQCFADSRIKGA